MGTENILSKITPKDYHNELEVILDDKDFKEDVKNLLLSCVYKIEAGYEDYKMVKRIVETKKELRDFNGWNWNTSPKEIGEVTLNLIYQNLIYLLGLPILKKWIYMGDTKDYLEVVKQKLILNYGEENAKEIFKWIEKLSFVILRRK